MELAPGISFGPLHCGATLQSTMSTLRTLVGPSHEVDLVVSSKTPGDCDIILNAKTIGICCRIDPKEQTLRLIEIYSLSTQSLLFRGANLGPTPTLRSILKRLGPTYPGHTDTDNDFILGYPGIAFVFPTPAHLHTTQPVSADLLLAIPSESTPIASRIYIFNPSASLTSVSKQAIKSAPPLLLKPRQLAFIHAVPGRGSSFPFTNVDMPKSLAPPPSSKKRHSPATPRLFFLLC
ncbi:hypothetical protein HDU98_006499 [Podochytrium sp. JEL0797]|nr:hypothetical protein HDU98_006499 [Podochytrium sp. JEL0797]